MADIRRLLNQISQATAHQTARYILTAVIDGVDYDAGETNIYRYSDIIKTRDNIVNIATHNLKRFHLTIEQINRAEITIQEAPALY